MPSNLHRHLSDHGVKVLGTMAIVAVILTTCTLLFNGGFVQ